MGSAADASSSSWSPWDEPFRISFFSVSGRELAALDAAPSWRRPHVLNSVPQPEHPMLQWRILHGEAELCGEKTLAEIGAVSGSQLTLVLTERCCIATGSLDGTAKIWCRESGECLRTFADLGHCVEAVALSPNDQQAALLVAQGRTAQLWCTASCSCLCSYLGHAALVKSVAFSPEGRELLTASEDGTGKLWCRFGGRCLRTYAHHKDVVCSAAFSPSGLEVLTASADHSAKLWCKASGECLQCFLGHAHAVCSAAFSPEGLQVLTASVDGTWRLWDASTGGILRTSAAHVRGLVSAQLSPDGRQVLVVFDGGESAQLCCFSSGELLRSFRHGPLSVVLAAFSPDGLQVLTASTDNAKLWNVGAGDCLHTFSHRDMVSSAAFSPWGTKA